MTPDQKTRLAFNFYSLSTCRTEQDILNHPPIFGNKWSTIAIMLGDQLPLLEALAEDDLPAIEKRCLEDACEEIILAINHAEDSDFLSSDEKAKLIAKRINNSLNYLNEIK